MSSNDQECKLTEELEKKSFENLREDENLRSQALEQFREWITKHPRIKRCRMDAKFLLKFLRTKKFSVPDAVELLENYLTIRKVHPELFEQLSLDDPAIHHLLSHGCLLLLPEPDKQGRLVVSYDAEYFDVNKLTATDAIRAMNLILEIISLDERTQICGMTHVTDWSNFNLALVSIWTIPQIKKFALCMQKTFPLRHGAFINVNLPSYCIPLFKIIVSFFSEKLQKRVKIMKNWNNVFEEIGVPNPTQENAEKVPRAELAKKMMELAERHREEILSLNDFDIEVSDRDINFGNTHDADLDTAIVGSFRSINVD